MVTKIIFTLLIIIGAFWMLKRRSSGVAARQQINPDPNALKLSDLRIGAYLFIILMVLVSAVMLYRQWQDSSREVTVRVINTQTGESVTYQAHYGDVDGRSFRTLDGRSVTVADTERIELGGEK
jgi:hypothetical protein